MEAGLSPATERTEQLGCLALCPRCRSSVPSVAKTSFTDGGGMRRQPNISWQMITEAITPARSAMRPAATAWRARRTATEPK